MTKKLMNQRKQEDSEISTQTEANTESNASTDNPNRIEKKVNNKIRYDYSFYTPLKKIKINPLFQMATKKKMITLENDGLTIRGKNLFNIFKSM